MYRAGRTNASAAGCWEYIGYPAANARCPERAGSGCDALKQHPLTGSIPGQARVLLFLYHERQHRRFPGSVGSSQNNEFDT